MDVISLQKKNLWTNLKFSTIIIALVGNYLLPNISTFMKIVVTICLLLGLFALLWSTFFVKNEIIFDNEKLIINRYKERFEFNYSGIDSINYAIHDPSESNNTHGVTVRKHYLIIVDKNSEEMVIELFGNVFIEDEIRRLFKKYNLESL